MGRGLLIGSDSARKITIRTNLREVFEIPTVVIQRKIDEWKTDSYAEEEFLSILEKHGFPSPTNFQYEVKLNGEYSIVDFAFVDDFFKDHSNFNRWYLKKDTR